MEHKYEKCLFSGTENNADAHFKLFKAGRITFVFDHGAIRKLSYDGNVVISQIYFALRDQSWGTIPFEMSDVCVQEGESIRFRACHRQSPVEFEWIGTIRVHQDTSLVFSFEGSACSDFLSNRIGFCVLHPLDVAGQPCSVTHCDGTSEQGAFPDYISPHQPFYSIRSISHRTKDGAEVCVSFEGDEFEMEDQRNWTDASFKTYCTPLERAFPVQIRTGDRFCQSVSVFAKGKQDNSSGGSTEMLTADFTHAEEHELLSLGSCYAQDLSPKQVQRLQRLNLGHLRVDLAFGKDAVSKILDRTLKLADILNTGLLVCAHFTEDFENEMQILVDAVKKAGNLILGVCVFKNGEKVTENSWVRLAREKFLETGVAVGSGTDGFFAQLNRERPESSLLDFVAYSNTPQVHTFNNLSIVETLLGQEANVQSVRNFMKDVPVYVSPITFKVRWNPDAGGKPIPVPGALPEQVDARQMSLFGAAWTLGSVVAMIRSGASLATYYELVGWKGMMEREEGCEMPYLFPSKAGMVFPMYFVLVWLGEFKGGRAYVAQAEPCRAAAVLLELGEKRRLLLANLSAQAESVCVRSLGGEGRMKLLGMETVGRAVEDPEAYLLSKAGALVTINVENGISLPAYSVACIDLTI